MSSVIAYSTKEDFKVIDEFMDQTMESLRLMIAAETRDAIASFREVER